MYQHNLKERIYLLKVLGDERERNLGGWVFWGKKDTRVNK